MMVGRFGVISGERDEPKKEPHAGLEAADASLSGTAPDSETLDDPRDRCNVAIVDSRQCLRDPLADAFVSKLGVAVSVHESLSALIISDVAPASISSVVCQLCSGTSRQELEQSIATLREWAPETNIILLSDKLTREIADICASLGIRGLVSSEYSTGQILVCVSVVEAGLSYIPADIGNRSQGTELPSTDVNDVKLPDLDGMLTPRQQQVMRYIAIGKSNKYIAVELSLCESTVKVHVSELMRRLGATSRTHASYIINQLEIQRRELA